MARAFASDINSYLSLSTMPVTAAPFTVFCMLNGILVGTNNIWHIGDDATKVDYWCGGTLAGGSGVRITCGVRDTANLGAEISVTHDPAVNNGVWFGITWQIISATSRIIRTLNGSTSSATSRSPSAATKLILGRRELAVPDRQLNAHVAHFAIWDANIGNAACAELVAGRSPKTVARANLKGYWPLVGATLPEPDWRGLASLAQTGTVAASSGPVMRGGFSR